MDLKGMFSYNIKEYKSKLEQDINEKKELLASIKASGNNLEEVLRLEDEINLLNTKITKINNLNEKLIDALELIYESQFDRDKLIEKKESLINSLNIKIANLTAANENLFKYLEVIYNSKFEKNASLTDSKKRCMHLENRIKENKKSIEKMEIKKNMLNNASDQNLVYMLIDTSKFNKEELFYLNVFKSLEKLSDASDILNNNANIQSLISTDSSIKELIKLLLDFINLYFKIDTVEISMPKLFFVENMEFAFEELDTAIIEEYHNLFFDKKELNESDFNYLKQLFRSFEITMNGCNGLISNLFKDLNNIPNFDSNLKKIYKTVFHSADSSFEDTYKTKVADYYKDMYSQEDLAKLNLLEEETISEYYLNKFQRQNLQRRIDLSKFDIYKQILYYYDKRTRQFFALFMNITNIKGTVKLKEIRKYFEIYRNIYLSNVIKINKIIKETEIKFNELNQERNSKLDSIKQKINLLTGFNLDDKILIFLAQEALSIYNEDCVYYNQILNDYFNVLEITDLFYKSYKEGNKDILKKELSSN